MSLTIALLTKRQKPDSAIVINGLRYGLHIGGL
jgi:hypothetical protein